MCAHTQYKAEKSHLKQDHVSFNLVSCTDWSILTHCYINIDVIINAVFLLTVHLFQGAIINMENQFGFHWTNFADSDRAIYQATAEGETVSQMTSPVRPKHYH